MSGSFTLQAERVPLPDGETALVARLTGKIDATTAMEFEDGLDRLMALPAAALILHCGGVEYINSTGLGVLIKCHDALARSDRALELAAVTAKTRMVFSMLGLANFFVIHEDERAALEALAGARRGAALAPVRAAHAPPGFPLRFTCKRCTRKLRVAQPGRYRCPECGVFYAAAEGGKVRGFLQLPPRRVELVAPLAPEFIDPLRRAGRALAEQCRFGSADLDAIEQAIDEACSLALLGGAPPGRQWETYFVADERELILAFRLPERVLGNGHDDPQARMSRQILENIMDELQVLEVPGGGQILKLTKRRQ